MVTAGATPFQPDTLACGTSKLTQHLRRDRLAPWVLQYGPGALGVGLGLIAERLEAVDAILERRVV